MVVFKRFFFPSFFISFVALALPFSTLSVHAGMKQQLQVEEENESAAVEGGIETVQQQGVQSGPALNGTVCTNPINLGVLDLASIRIPQQSLTVMFSSVANFSNQLFLLNLKPVNSPSVQAMMTIPMDVSAGTNALVITNWPATFRAPLKSKVYIATLSSQDLCFNFLLNVQVDDDGAPPIGTDPTQNDGANTGGILIGSSGTGDNGTSGFGASAGAGASVGSCGAIHSRSSSETEPSGFTWMLVGLLLAVGFSLNRLRKFELRERARN